MEVDRRMALEPAVALGFVRIEVVKHDMDLPVRVLGDDLVEEAEELAASAAAVT